jgi:hypothetical protein
MPDQWAPDTRSAMDRRDSLFGQLKDLLANAQSRREEYLKTITGFGEQQVPGGGTAGGMLGPIGGREFRFGGGNAGSYLQVDMAPVKEMSTWQRRMAEAYQKRFRDADRVRVNRTMERQLYGVNSPDWDYVGNKARF